MGLTERSTYLEDDWDDNALSARTSPEEGYFLHPSDGLTGAGDYEPGDALKGVYRPDWKGHSGTASATNQRVELSDGSTTSQGIRTPTEFTTGTWSFDRNILTTPSTGAIAFTLIYTPNSGNWWQYRNDPGSSLEGLVKKEGGTFSEVITSGADSSTGNDSIKLTRDSYGNWEYLKNGSAVGTTTDTHLPDPKYQDITNWMDASVAVDNMVIQ